LFTQPQLQSTLEAVAFLFPAKYHLTSFQSFSHFKQEEIQVVNCPVPPNDA